MIDGIEEAMAELISGLKKISKILNRPDISAEMDRTSVDIDNCRLRKASVARPGLSKHSPDPTMTPFFY